MPEQEATLRDMIQRELDKGTNYRQLAARATDPVTGVTASHSLFNNIVIGKVDRMPYDYHLRAIAAGLAVPYERVRQAAIAQWLPPEAEDQSEDLRRQLLELRARTEQAIARLDETNSRAASA